MFNSLPPYMYFFIRELEIKKHKLHVFFFFFWRTIQLAQKSDLLYAKHEISRKSSGLRVETVNLSLAWSLLIYRCPYALDHRALVLSVLLTRCVTWGRLWISLTLRSLPSSSGKHATYSLACNSWDKFDLSRPMMDVSTCSLCKYLYLFEGNRIYLRLLVILLGSMCIVGVKTVDSNVKQPWFKSFVSKQGELGELLNLSLLVSWSIKWAR